MATDPRKRPLLWCYFCKSRHVADDRHADIEAILRELRAFDDRRMKAEIERESGR